MARYIYSLLLTTVPPESPYPAPCPHRIPTSPNRTDGGHAIPNSSLLIPYCWAYTFSAKERDPETGLSYFGSRYYSSDLSIWLSVDPMSAKYPSLSPYVYCANNPIFFKDPNGDSVAVLLAKSSPIVGHMAILIQIHGGENDGKWALWSKNGENKTWSQSAVDLSDDKGGRVWNSPQEFLNMNDEKYEDAYVIPTTKKQDKQITEGFRKSQDINYDLLEANCSIAVQSGLKAGGLKKCKSIYLSARHVSTIVD